MRKAPFTIHPVTAAVVIITLVALLAGCGSSKSSKSSSTKTKGSSGSTSSAPTTQAAAASVVTAKKDAKLGTVLADRTGATLYTLTSNGKAVPCSGACAQAWPPLELPAGVSAPTGSSGITGLSAVPGPDGTQLVAVNGLPLYRFVKDEDAEDAYGEGVASFGGVWHVSKTSAPVTPAASSAEPTTEEPTTTAPASSGSGY